MGLTFLFSRKKKIGSFRNPKLKNGFKIIMPRTKQITHQKKFFSRNTPPIHKFLSEKKSKGMTTFLLAIILGRPPHPPNCSQGRRRRRRPLFPICAPCTKTTSKLCAKLPIDFFLKVCYNNYRS